MLITITGMNGSWKSTAATIIAEMLGYEYVSIGNMKRKLAAEMWISISEFDELWLRPENQKDFDLKYEDYQRSLSSDANIILDSRLGFWCQPHSFKIFLTVDAHEAAKRIFSQKRKTDSYATEEEVYIATKGRNDEMLERFQKLYNVNYQDTANFDLVLDTTNKTTEETVSLIINAFTQRQTNHA